MSETGDGDDANRSDAPELLEDAKIGDSGMSTHVTVAQTAISWSSCKYKAALFYPPVVPPDDLQSSAPRPLAIP